MSIKKVRDGAPGELKAYNNDRRRIQLTNATSLFLVHCLCLVREDWYVLRFLGLSLRAVSTSVIEVTSSSSMLACFGIYYEGVE